MPMAKAILSMGMDAKEYEELQKQLRGFWMIWMKSSRKATLT